MVTGAVAHCIFSGRVPEMTGAYYGFGKDMVTLLYKPVLINFAGHLFRRFMASLLPCVIRCWFVFAVIISPLSVAESLNIAVASNFRAAMKELQVVFDPEKKHDIRVSYGSSGKLFAQIVHGAPFDVFLSADSLKPEKLVEMKLAQANYQITYTIGRLALWCPVLCQGSNTEEVLLKQKFDRIAMANAKLAPYGLAAAQTMAYLNVSTKPGQLIRGENIAQVYHFVASGAAPIGFVALPQVLGKAGIKPSTVWKIPKHMHGQIKQDAVLLGRGESNKLAHQFLSFLQQPSTQQLLSKQGYDSVSDSGSEPARKHKKIKILDSAAAIEIASSRVDIDFTLSREDRLYAID